MKKLFLHSGKMMIGEFPDVQTNALSALSVLNECEAAVSAAKASAVEVVNGEDALHKINDWFLPLPGGGLGRKLNEGQLCDLPTGWTVEYEKQCQYQETDGNCPDCFRGSLCKKIAHLIPASNASGIKYMHDRECRRYRDESVLCQNHCYFKTSGIKECPIKSSGIAAIGVPESGDFDVEPQWMVKEKDIPVVHAQLDRILGKKSSSPVIPEGSEKEQPKRKAVQACAKWLAYCLEIGYTKNQLDALEKIWWDGHDVNGNLKPADKPAIDDTLKETWDGKFTQDEIQEAVRMARNDIFKKVLQCFRQDPTQSKSDVFAEIKELKQ
jgi:hypothetical protein